MQSKIKYTTALLLVLAIFGCKSTQLLPSSQKSTTDTLWREILTYDKLVVESNPIIKITSDSTISIKPYIAIIDSLINLNNRSLRLTARYSVPDNKFNMNIDEIRVDSLPVITVIKENSYEKPAPSNSTLTYIISVFAGLVMIGMIYVIILHSAKKV